MPGGGAGTASPSPPQPPWGQGGTDLSLEPNTGPYRQALAKESVRRVLDPKEDTPRLEQGQKKAQELKTSVAGLPE